MPNLRNAIKLSFALLALWLGLIWANILPRPAVFPPELDIEPLTFILGATAALLFGFWKSTPPSVDKPNTSLDFSLRNELIANLQAKYKKRIDSKLAGRFPVNLRINTSKTGTSEDSAKKFNTFQDTEIGHKIGEIFDRANGRLLVIGLPGAGKTTLLLQLALELLQRAENAITQHQRQNHYPITPSIPILLNLATWRSEFNTFDNWLRRILPNELGASQALADRIYVNTPLILLLDGLDEMPEQDRNSCLEALGLYGIKPEGQFAVSSRILEYAAAKDAPVYGQVEVAPLTAEQIEMNLTAYAGLTPEARPLLHAIQQDPLLKQSLENPFYLNTAQLLFASGKNWSDFGFVATDVAERQRELVQYFVEYALTHKEKRDYPAGKAERWLRFLAVMMEEEFWAITLLNISPTNTFELTKIQPYWLDKEWIFRGLLAPVKLILFIPLILLFLGPTVVYSYEGFSDLFGNKYYIIGAFFIIFSVNAIFDKDFLSYIIYTSEKRKLWVGIPNGEVWFITFISILMGIGSGLAWWMINPVWGIMAGFFWTALLYIIFASRIERFLKLNSPYERFYASLINLNFSIIDHVLLRIILSLRKSLPLRLVYFLNEMSRRHLLEFDGDLNTESGGGSWRWRHRIIQEWFLQEKK